MEDNEIEWFYSDEQNEHGFHGNGWNSEAQDFMKEICNKCYRPPTKVRGINYGCLDCKPRKRFQERQFNKMLWNDIMFESGRCKECNRFKEEVNKDSKMCKQCYGMKKKRNENKRKGQ